MPLFSSLAKVAFGEQSQHCRAEVGSKSRIPAGLQVDSLPLLSADGVLLFGNGDVVGNEEGDLGCMQRTRGPHPAATRLEHLDDLLADCVCACEELQKTIASDVLAVPHAACSAEFSTNSTVGSDYMKYASVP
jgi:hypothetical protein